MKILYALTLSIILGLNLSSCGGSESDPQNSEASPVKSQASRFTKEMDKGCDLLTAELVASTFGVPAENLKQMKVLGCIYTGGNDSRKLQAHLMRPRVHKDTAAAAAWFAKTTRSRSAEEMQIEMDKIAQRLEDQKELDTGAKKSVAKLVLNSVGSKAVIFEDVANVGDEARSGEDGDLSIRVSNLTFNLSAYHGPAKPEVNVAELAGLNVKELIAAGKKHEEDWGKKSASQRTIDSTKLAKALIAEF